MMDFASLAFAYKPQKKGMGFLSLGFYKLLGPKIDPQPCLGWGDFLGRFGPEPIGGFSCQAQQ
jgi:hypothetical protein